tara:strand:- start:12146 stop:12310 length:165 start_codon:yes stop_codon:yes gene_type:complete
MTHQRIHQTGANNWHRPAPRHDWQRRMTHGPIRPMERPGLLARLFGAMKGSSHE